MSIAVPSLNFPGFTIPAMLAYCTVMMAYCKSVASEAYHDWSGEAADAQLRVNFTLKLLLSQNFCNQPLMRFISFASNIGPAAAVPAGPAPSPLQIHADHRTCCV